VTPRVISCMPLCLMEISIFIVGEIFSIFPFSNALGVGIGYFNQSTWREGMKSLASMVQTREFEGVQKELWERKKDR
jgi:hypothetical protein